MDVTRGRVRTVLQAIVHEFKVERITFMAGSIAYNAFVSLLPMLFLLLAFVSAVGDQQIESSLIELVQGVVTPGAGDVLVSELRKASAGASVLGLVVLVWGMLRIFRSLDTAFSDIYETEAENTFTDQLFDGIAVFVSMAGVIVVAAALESAVSVSAGSGVLWFGQRLLLIVAVGLALAPMYYLFPDESGMTVVEIVPGVTFTATGLVLFQSVFSLYIRFSSQNAENGVLAGILVFMTWLYFSGLVILLGAVINAVLSNRSEDVNIEPVVEGVPKAGVVSADREERDVPDTELERTRQLLNGGESVHISVDDGTEEVVLPVPDRVTVDTDTTPVPALSGTAAIEFQWAEDEAGGVFTDDDAR